MKNSKSSKMITRSVMLWKFKFPDAILAALGMYAMIYVSAVLGFKTLNPVEIFLKFYSKYGLFITLYMWLILPLIAAYWIPKDT